MTDSQTITVTVAFRPLAQGLPDAETNVLLLLADGTTCEGFYDGHWEDAEGQPPLFRDVCADPLDRDVVTHWADMPQRTAAPAASDRVDPTACPACVGAGVDLEGVAAGTACATCDGTGDAPGVRDDGNARALNRNAGEAAEVPQVVSDLLALVGIDAPADVVATWSPEMQTAAAEWAGACHLSASDNDNEVPARPAFIPEPWTGPMQGEGIWATNPTPMRAEAVREVSR